jgi:hypothetical protein
VGTGSAWLEGTTGTCTRRGAAASQRMVAVAAALVTPFAWVFGPLASPVSS